jgi:rubrerythrin
MKSSIRSVVTAAILLFLGLSPLRAMASLRAETLDALAEALAEERGSLQQYREVIARHGAVPPFSRIVPAETRHVRALLSLYTAHGEAIPAVSPPPIAAPATLREACAEAAASEQRRVEMYDRLLAQVTEPDVRTVFLRLRAASAERHLPAFRRCVARAR